MNASEPKICPIREIAAALMLGATGEMQTQPFCIGARCAFWQASPLTNSAGQSVGGRCGIVAKGGQP